MGIRIIARVRPQQKHELNQDVILSTISNGGNSVVKVLNPKKESELYSFQFSGVYDCSSTQQEIFDNESMFISMILDKTYRWLIDRLQQFLPQLSSCSMASTSQSLPMALPVPERLIQCAEESLWLIEASFHGYYRASIVEVERS